MYSTVLTGAVRGISSYLMQVEVDVSNGLPGFSMVGFMSSEVRETKDRVKVALKNAGMSLPASKITINLSPVDIKKEGVVIDLPVAIGILVATGQIDESALESTIVLGELGLDGEIKGIKGILPIVTMAKECGYKTVLLPDDNAKEGAVVQGMKIVGLKSLQEAVQYLTADDKDRDCLISPTTVNIEELFAGGGEYADAVDFADIRGQAAVKRAAEIAAAGFHHLLIVGPPGTGKSMIAKRIPTILPPLTPDESLEVSTIYSVAGMLGEGEFLKVKRPYVSTHHLVTKAAFVGGGNVPRPGLISLAHRGVLFLDEMPEFTRDKLDMLREPLEDRNVRIVRNRGTYTYPANFQLIGALNPCPCGYFPDRNRCKCSPKEIKRYLCNISEPILDRIDICVEAPRVDIGDLSDNGKSACESSADIRKRVVAARELQKERLKGSKIQFNSEMTPKDIEKYCRLGNRERAFIESAFNSMELSARAYHKILRVARTIADIDSSEEIRQIHLMEAVSYRMTDGKYWSKTEEE